MADELFHADRLTYGTKSLVAFFNLRTRLGNYLLD